ncbi:MAG: transcription antitermination factor NusB [Dissulfurispiraceae bacterium]
MKRRNAREYVLQFLYGTDFTKHVAFEKEKVQILPDIKADLSLFWQETREDSKEIKEFADDLIRGTIDHLEGIDAQIQRVAEKWKLLRMATVDRNILRSATYELLFRDDIPCAVTINEAIEIAKKFSTAESASFINGILDKIAKEYRQPSGG